MLLILGVTTVFEPLIFDRSHQQLLLIITAGAIALAEVLAENKHITHMDLRDNDIRVAGLMGLQLAHRMNHTLLHLDTPKFYKVEQVSLCTNLSGEDPLID